MPHNKYNLRINPKRKVVFSPVSENKRTNSNRSNIYLPIIKENMSNINETEEMAEDELRAAGPSMNSQPSTVPVTQGNGSLNENRSPFIPHGNLILPSQFFPPPHSNGHQYQLHGRPPPPPTDSNLANYIQKAIVDGMHSVMARENQNSVVMINAIQNLANLIDQRMVPQNVEPPRESTPTGCEVQDEEEIPEEHDAITRLERMVQNLSIQVSSINERVNNSNQNLPNNNNPQAQRAFSIRNNNAPQSYQPNLDQPL